MGKIKKIACMLLVTALFINVATVFALGENETTYTTLDTDLASLLSPAETASVSDTAFGPAGVEDGAVYALQNVGSELWASTSINTGTYFYIWNVFQNSDWNSTAQTFKFVKTGSGDNTYLIYPLEYNNYNSNLSRALYCNYNAISSEQPDTANVTYASYVASKASCYEWIVEQKDGYVHTIRLKADPRYILCGLGNTAGHDGSTTTGNIVVSKQSSATATPTNNQKWNMRYVIEDMWCYIRNRENNKYLYASDTAGLSMSSMNYSQYLDREWEIQHVQNGLYFLKSSNGLNLCLNEYSLMEGGDVFVDYNTAQVEYMWYIDRLEGGAYRIYNYYSVPHSSDYTVKVTNSSLTPDKVVYGCYSANNQYYDEWYFTDGYNVAFYGIPSMSNGYHDHSSYLMDIEELLSSRDNAFYDITSYYSETVPQAFTNSMKSSELFVVRTHGIPVDGIVVSSANTPPYVYQFATGILADEGEESFLFSHDHPFMSDYSAECSVIPNNSSFENAELVILAGCYTGRETNNLVSRIKGFGARAVIGFKDSIGCSVANDWIEKLFDELGAGKKLIDAIENACIDSGYSIENVTFLGDSSYYLP